MYKLQQYNALLLSISIVFVFQKDLIKALDTKLYIVIENFEVFILFNDRCLNVVAALWFY